MPALMLALAAYSADALCDERVGTVRNFGPNLQQTVCRQPEGIAVDPRGNVYASSKFGYGDDRPRVRLRPVTERSPTSSRFPTGTSPVIGLLGELFEEDQGLYVVDQADNVAPNGRLLKINPRTHAVTVFGHRLRVPQRHCAGPAPQPLRVGLGHGQIARIAPDGSKQHGLVRQPAAQTKQPRPARRRERPRLRQRPCFLYVANTETTAFCGFRCGGRQHAGAIEVFATARTSTVFVEGEAVRADGLVGVVRLSQRAVEPDRVARTVRSDARDLARGRVRHVEVAVRSCAMALGNTKPVAKTVTACVRGLILSRRPFGATLSA